MQPRQRRRGTSSAAYRRGRRESPELRRAVDVAARARRARPHARSRDNVEPCDRARARRWASSASTSTSSTARRARRSTTGARRSTARSRSTSSTSARTRSPSSRRRRSGPRVAAGARRARRRRAGRRVPAGRRGCSARRGLRVVRGVELGASRRGVPPQPPVLERGRVPRRSVRRARPHRRAAAGGTCARPSATSPRSRRERRPRPATSSSSPRPRPRRRARSRCGPAGARRARRGGGGVVDELAAAGSPGAPGRRPGRAHGSRPAARVRRDRPAPARGAPPSLALGNIECQRDA